jgi:hypothetical protein
VSTALALVTTTAIAANWPQACSPTGVSVGHYAIEFFRQEPQPVFVNAMPGAIECSLDRVGHRDEFGQTYREKSTFSQEINRGI